MVRSEFKKLNISLKENHLIDVYSNTSNYLELGTISFEVLNRLLNYEMIHLDDITYLPIQNTGFGKSNIRNERLKSYIPYMYFQNINQKNRPLQVFITHGIIRYKDLKNKEVFSPLILIPVNIFFENGRVYFQQVSEPIENAVLLDTLQRERKITISSSEKLDNIFSIEKYYLNFLKYEGFKFEFENYITYASVISSEAVINQNKFNLNKLHESYLFENLYNNDNIVYYSKKHNINQRNALYQALDGKSFVITGRLGTGKSTVLKDIAINAMADGSRVLYVSNMKETLDEVYKFFENKKMQYYVTNFSNSFSSFHNGELVLPNTEKLSSATNFDELLKNYKYIKDYQSAMTGRILDYRFIDVINELILLQGESKNILEIDSLDHVYKYEYLEILNAVENIAENLKEIADFKNSVWKEIPIINDIKYPNQVITLIHKVHGGFIELDEYKQSLEQVYGFKEIGNYAYLKNVLHNFRNLNVHEIPKSWYERKYYELAKNEYHKLKTLIFTLQELEYDLDLRFDNLDKFEIKKELSSLYGEYFTKDDLEKINKIINERLKVVVLLNKALVQVDIFNKSNIKLKKILNFDFDLTNENIFEIIKLAKIILETNINSKYIKSIIDGKFKEVHLEASRSLSNYLQYNSEKEHLFDNLPFIKFGSVDEAIKVFENFDNNEKIKRIQKKVLEKLKLEDETGYQKIIEAIKRYNELNTLIKIEDDLFISLLDYHPDQVYIDDYVKVNEFINSISNVTIKSKVLKFLKKTKDLDDAKNKNYHKVFDYFQKSYTRINVFYEQLMVYEFSELKDEFNDRLYEIGKINAYIQKSFHSNDLLYSIKKISTSDYVSAEDYYYIDEAFNKIEEIKKELNTNKDFPVLFGNIYNTYNTDLSKLSKLIQTFRLYIECFENDEFVMNSLNSEVYTKINNLLNVSSDTVESLNDVFKLYFKIFKNSVSRFYYAEFSDNINYLNELLNKKDVLIIYLKITDNLQVLAKFRLYKFIEYIVYLKDSSTLVNDFKYTYLTNIKEIYLKKYPYLRNYKSFEAALRISTILEDEIIDAVEDRIFKKIKKRSSSRFSVFGIKNLDYNSFVRRTSGIKHLFLTNTQVLNNFLNIKDYDLILIDDAHLFDANEYSYALQGEQVVVAGEMQLHEAVANNLISRISLSKSIEFDFRYDVMPKDLKNYATGLNAPIYQNFYDNHGVEVITYDVYEYIAALFKVNKEYRINLFVASLVMQRVVYEKVTNLLLDGGFTVEEIIDILSTKLNITDLRQAYLFESDYNILYLEDYYHYDEDYIVANMIDDILLCKNKLVIYDNNDFLSSSTSTNFLIELNSIIANKNVFYPTYLQGSINKLIDALQDHKILCYTSDLCTFLIKVKSNLHGIIIYWDTSKTNYDILNEFRDIHTLKDSRIKKNIVVWAMELVDDFDGVVARIMDEVKDDQR